MTMFNLAYGLIAVTTFLSRAAAITACSSDLLIDDFDQFSRSVNVLGTRASDDGSMRSLNLSAAAPNTSSSSIAFVPEQGSYFYETLPCTRAASRGYDAVSFAVRAPHDGASFILEVQTRASCDAASYASAWAPVSDLAAGEPQTVVVPLSAFGSAINADAVTAFNWATWDAWGDGVVWGLADIALVCSAGGGGCASRG
ncbi:hypothetical protein SLS62_001858 [Diatrype stigma]|uniref:Uncharacterized protein n=1 Tax=Diatrype stigma TaxID=117547 RepID=A0AAN9V059_9PEZI